LFFREWLNKYEPAMSSTKKIVLVVDDDKSISEMIKRLLKYYDSSLFVEIVHDGTVAIQKINELLPNLITLDINIPGSNGYEVCKTIKTNEKTKHIPIIVISGEEDKDAKSKMLSLGADGFLPKPFDINNFLNIIPILLKK